MKKSHLKQRRLQCPLRSFCPVSDICKLNFLVRNRKEKALSPLRMKADSNRILWSLQSWGDREALFIVDFPKGLFLQSPFCRRVGSQKVPNAATNNDHRN